MVRTFGYCWSVRVGTIVPIAKIIRMLLILVEIIVLVALIVIIVITAIRVIIVVVAERVCKSSAATFGIRVWGLRLCCCCCFGWGFHDYNKKEQEVGEGGSLFRDSFGND